MTFGSLLSLLQHGAFPPDLAGGRGIFLFLSSLQQTLHKQPMQAVMCALLLNGSTYLQSPYCYLGGVHLVARTTVSPAGDVCAHAQLIYDLL